MKRLLLTIALICIPAHAGDIRFPTHIESVDVVPVPASVEVAVDTLEASEWYVIDSDKPLIVLASPEGIVGVESLTGPMTFRGKFPGSTKFETRTFAGPHLFAVTAEAAGKAELIVVPVGATGADDVIRKVLTVSGGGPNPPPKPEPDPGPRPEPLPVPGKLQIVIIEDPAQKATLPASQIAVLDGRDVRQYAAGHCLTTEGAPDFRVLSVRADVSKAAPWIQEAFAVPRTKLPFMVILGSKTISGPLPATVDQTMELLRKYGGD